MKSLKKMMPFILLIVTFVSAQDMRDTVIVRQDGTAVRMQTKILNKFDASFDGGYAIKHFSDEDINNLFKGRKVFRRQPIGSAPNISYPLFGTLEVAYDDYYSLKAGKLIRERKQVEYESDNGYFMTAVANIILFLALVWSLSDLKKKEKTKAVGAFFLTSGVVLLIFILAIYFVNWVVISMSGVYEITAVGVFGSLAAIFSIVFILAIVNSAADFKIEAIEITIAVITSFIVNIGMGMVAGFDFGLFSRQAGAIWLFFGLYIGLGFLGWLTRVIIAFCRSFNEPINIDMAQDPDLQNLT